ncbi:Helix-turn-helix domain [Burkholderia pseudomallei]|jgi:predicted site-specific integrase-resolvase|nr:Helix-turn-helix domain [Burkholderia pseudomallei]CAJ7268717.1 Helix-turn-helix domain [Burkholderia pseudomallei]
MFKTIFLNPVQAAEYLQIKPATLAVWRSSGRYNLPYVKVGGRVQYRLQDIEEFISTRVHLHTGN